MRIGRLLIALCAPLVCYPVLADTYPSKPIRLIVPFAPGGSTDIIARAVGDALGRQLGQPVIVENKPGGAGTIGAGQIMRASALLARFPKPTDEQIDTEMAANLCRCGTYVRIRKAIHSAAARIAKTGGAS